MVEEDSAHQAVNHHSCAVCLYLHRFDVSNCIRCAPRPPTSETACLSGGCSSCPGCGGTRAAGCVLLGCSQTGWTLWSRSSGCLRSAGVTHSDWQQQQHYTSVAPVNSWTRATREAWLAGAFISVNMVIDTPALICWSPGRFPKVPTTDEVGEEMQRWLVDRNREKRRRREGAEGDYGSVKHRRRRLWFRTAAWNGCAPVGDTLTGDLIWRMISNHF